VEKKAGKKKGTGKEKATSEKPVSLYPLTPEEVLGKLLHSPPPAGDGTKQKPTRTNE
jgi:hypothetical protein